MYRIILTLPCLNVLLVSAYPRQLFLIPNPESRHIPCHALRRVLELYGL